MPDLVDLLVVGTTDDLNEAQMAERLAQAAALLGRPTPEPSDPTADQPVALFSGIEREQVESHLEQLQQWGLSCELRQASADAQISDAELELFEDVDALGLEQPLADTPTEPEEAPSQAPEAVTFDDAFADLDDDVSAGSASNQPEPEAPQAQSTEAGGQRADAGVDEGTQAEIDTPAHAVSHAGGGDSLMDELEAAMAGCGEIDLPEASDHRASADAPADDTTAADDLPDEIEVNQAPAEDATQAETEQVSLPTDEVNDGVVVDEPTAVVELSLAEESDEPATPAPPAAADSAAAGDVASILAGSVAAEAPDLSGISLTPIDDAEASAPQAPATIEAEPKSAGQASIDDLPDTPMLVDADDAQTDDQAAPPGDGAVDEIDESKGLAPADEESEPSSVLQEESASDQEATVPPADEPEPVDPVADLEMALEAEAQPAPEPEPEPLPEPAAEPQSVAGGAEPMAEVEAPGEPVDEMPVPVVPALDDAMGQCKTEVLRKSREEIAQIKNRLDADKAEEDVVARQFQLKRRATEPRVLAAIGAFLLIGVGIGGWLSVDWQPEPAVDIQQQAQAVATQVKQAPENDPVFKLAMRRTVAAESVAGAEVGALVERLSSVFNTAGLTEITARYNLEPVQAAALPATKTSSTDAAQSPDEFLDSWLHRQALLRSYQELLSRVGVDHGVEFATEMVEHTDDRWLRVMGRHRLIEQLQNAPDSSDRERQLEQASREAYAIQAPAERVIAIADIALVEKETGMDSQAEDSFLEASILGGTLVEATERLVANARIGALMYRAGDLHGATTHFRYAQVAADSLAPGVAHDLGRMQLAENLATAGFTGKALAEIEKIDDPYIAVPAAVVVSSAFKQMDDQTSVRSAVVLAHRLGSAIVKPVHRDLLLARVNATLTH